MPGGNVAAPPVQRNLVPACSRGDGRCGDKGGEAAGGGGAGGVVDGGVAHD